MTRESSLAQPAAKTFSRISLDLDAPIARITLDHPPLNVIDMEMMEELAQALVEIEDQGPISVLVLAARGTAFSVGVDVAAHTPDKVPQMLEKFHSVIRMLVASKKVTLASVHGHCLGGGAELAMVCDLVYTTENAEWGFPEIKLACYPPVAVTALAALVPAKQALELVLTGRTLRGREAASIGLATRALPEEQLEATREESIARLARLSPAALAVTKRAFYVWDSIHFDKGLARAEKIYREELMATKDAQEGINAFLEKREPKWQGQ